MKNLLPVKRWNSPHHAGGADLIRSGIYPYYLWYHSVLVLAHHMVSVVDLNWNNHLDGYHDRDDHQLPVTYFNILTIHTTNSSIPETPSIEATCMKVCSQS